MADGIHVTPRDRAVATIAARQHGVIALSQLRALGLSNSAVRTRVAAGRLHPVHRGVYAVGHPILTTEARWSAAVLACGPGALLSHRSAAECLDLRPCARALIDVTVPGIAQRSRPGIDLHGTRRLHPDDITTVNGIPCTTVARTLLDLTEVLDRREVERAYERAEVLRVLDRRAVKRALGRADGRRGAWKLREIAADQRLDEGVTRNELEERFLCLCADAGIPRPRVNAWITLPDGAVQVDFLWPAERLIVETDGHRAHGTRHAFERDRRRDQRLMLAGWRVMRCTWRQLTRSPHDVVDAVTRLLWSPGGSHP